MLSQAARATRRCSLPITVRSIDWGSAHGQPAARRFEPGRFQQRVPQRIIQLAQTSSSGDPMQAEADAYAQCMQRAGIRPLQCPSDAQGTAGDHAGRHRARSAQLDRRRRGPRRCGSDSGAGWNARWRDCRRAGADGLPCVCDRVTGLVQIGMGGTLGQTSDGRQAAGVGRTQATQRFRARHDDQHRRGRGRGRAAGLLNDVAIAAINVSDALEQAASPTTTTTQTTSTTTTSTTTNDNWE